MAITVKKWAARWLASWKRHSREVLVRRPAGLVFTGLAIASLGVPPRARSQTITWVDEGGRYVFVNADDQELNAAVARGGVAAALRVIERRKQSLPGIEEYIKTASRRYRMDPDLVHAVIDVESAWNPRARSRKGALGLMQLLPETGARFGVRDCFNPKENVLGGVRYLRFLLDRFGSDLRLALAAYNAGENAVARTGDVPLFVETQRYVAQVEARYRESGSAGGSSPAAIYAMLENGRVVFANY